MCVGRHGGTCQGVFMGCMSAYLLVCVGRANLVPVLIYGRCGQVDGEEGRGGGGEGVVLVRWLG